MSRRLSLPRCRLCAWPSSVPSVHVVQKSYAPMGAYCTSSASQANPRAGSNRSRPRAAEFMPCGAIRFGAIEYAGAGDTIAGCAPPKKRLPRSAMTHATEFAPGLVVQGIEAPLSLSSYKLIAFDMDSTLINIECVDEIADAAGRKAEVAAITEAAMQGVITDYKESLRQRVALLKGVTVQHMEQVFTERMRFNPGAKELVTAAKAAGLTTLLVSGGFTFFADRVKAGLGIDFARSNMLEVQDGQLTGRMVDQAWGDICDGAEKRRTLLEVASLMGISPQQAIAVGDGPNDLPRRGAAGLSVAYHAKPAVRAQAKVAINQGGLDRLLEVLRRSTTGPPSSHAESPHHP